MLGEHVTSAPLLCCRTLNLAARRDLSFKRQKATTKQRKSKQQPAAPASNPSILASSSSLHPPRCDQSNQPTEPQTHADLQLPNRPPQTPQTPNATVGVRAATYALVSINDNGCLTYKVLHTLCTPVLSN
jgi:hypothetical protein